MARKRMIDPSFWEDEKLGELDPRARLLFMGLISQADDEGRLNGHPSLVRSNIFPYDDEIMIKDVDTWLNQMRERNIIVRYEVNSQKYILIRNFKKHQTINRPQPSKLPEPISEQSLNIHTHVTEQSDTDHAQGKLKEEKLKEEEYKAKGREVPAPDSNPHKDFIHKLVNECEIENYNLFDLEELYSYIGMVDIEVIEAAVKKGYKKESLRYVISTLKGMIKDGKTKKEHLFVKPIPGQAPQQSDRTKSGKHVLHIVTDSPVNTALTFEEMEEIRKVARKLDGPREMDGAS